MAWTSEIESELDRVSRQWKRLGCGFGCEQSDDPVDLEDAIINAVKSAEYSDRIHIMAMTWVVKYGDLVSVQKLVRKAKGLENQYVAVLGATLDICVHNGADKKLLAVIKHCDPLETPKVLRVLRSSRLNSQYRAQEIVNALPQWKKWGLFCSEIEFKFDAIRTREYVFQHNFNLSLRALFGSNAKAEILWILYDRQYSFAREIMRICGLSFFPIQKELSHMLENGLLVAKPLGRTKILELSPKMREMLAHAMA